MALIPFNTQVSSQQTQGRVSRTATAPDFFGGGTARDAISIGAKSLDVLADVQIKRKRRDDLDAVMTADTLFKRVESQKTREFTALTGNKARDLSPQALTWFDRNTSIEGQDATPEEAEYQEYYSSMSEEQKTFYDKKRSQRRLGFLETIEKHEEVESLAAFKDVYLANNEASLNAATAEFNNPGAVIQSMIDINNNVWSYGKSVGWPKERIDAETSKQMGFFHEGIVNAFLAADDHEGAAAYAKANKPDKTNIASIPGTAWAGIQKKIKTGVTLGRAQASFDSITVKKDPDEWIAEARKIKDPRVRRETEALVRRGLGDLAQNKTDNENLASSRIYNEYILNDVKSVKDIPFHLWEALSQPKQEVMRGLIEKVGKEKDVITDTNVYGRLTEMASTEGLQKEFLNLDLTGEFGDKLSRADIKHFENSKAKIRGDAGDFTGPQMMNDIFKDFGWDKEAKSELRYEAIIRIDKFAREEGQKTGKAVTMDRLAQIAKAVMNPSFVFRMEAAQARKEREPEPPKDTVTLTQQITTGLSIISDGLTNDERRIRKGVVTDSINSKILSTENIIGRRMRDEERQVLVDATLEDKVFVEGFFFDDEKLLSEVTEEEKKDVYVEVNGVKATLLEIEQLLESDPDKEKEIFKSLRELGNPPTLQNIADQIGIIKRDAAQADVEKNLKLRNRNPKLFDAMKDQGMDPDIMRSIIENIDPVVASNKKQEAIKRNSKPKSFAPLTSEKVGKTQEGRTVFRNEDGTVSSERSITIEVDGKFVNIPTIFKGKEVSPKEAFKIIKKNDFVDPETGKKLKFFGSEKQAIAAAEKKSRLIRF